MQVLTPSKTWDVCVVGSGAGGGMAAKVLSEGPAMLAGREGYQFVLQQAIKSAAGGTQGQGEEPPVNIVQRCLCVPAEGTPFGRGYSVVVVFQGDGVKPAEALMEKIAGGFELLSAALRPPEGAGAAETSPAETSARTGPATASAPASAPASGSVSASASSPSAAAAPASVPATTPAPATEPSRATMPGLDLLEKTLAPAEPL